MRISSTARTTAAVVAVMATAALLGCSDSDLGPSVPTGAIEIGGPPMTSTPPPPPGWTFDEVIPQSQRQAQDTVLGYLQRTLSALPAGTLLDSGRYVSSGQTAWCEDEPKDPKAVPIRFQTIGKLTVPDDRDPGALVATVGDIWRSWGWHVFERDGFNKPNQFGYGPDGYRLQIEMANPPDYPPTLTAISPCFPGDRAQDGLSFPKVIDRP